MKKLFLFLFVFELFYSCSPGNKNTTSSAVIRTDSMHYANGLSITHYEDFTMVEVKDPWEEGKLLQRYILVGHEQPLPDDLPLGTVVRVPLQDVVVYTSIHASVINMLGEADRIVGICEPRYMEFAEIQDGLKSGKIHDLGESSSPNVEKMIEIGAKVVIASPFQNSNYGSVEKIGIPIIEGADYMEAHPLGRTEWIRFYGLLFGKQEKADSIFSETEHRYNELKELVADVAYRPTVLSEKRFGSTWFVPAGDSYVAHLFRDAGANYFFNDLEGSGSKPMAFESVLERAIDADFWLIKYNQASDMTYSELRTEYTPNENFRAFREQKIFGCNTGRVPYYEESPLYPDYLLKDLISIFHPNLTPGYTRRYYSTMNTF